MKSIFTRSIFSLVLLFGMAASFWIATDAIEYSGLTSGLFADAEISCDGCNRHIDGGSGHGLGGFGGFGGGGGGELGTGGGGGGTPPKAPICTLDLTQNQIDWTTQNATSVDIIPLTASPVVPGANAALSIPPGTVIFNGDFGAFKAQFAHVFQADATAHGGVTLGSASFKANKTTADRLCQLAFPGTVVNSFSSDTFSSPKNNTIAIWNGSAWSVVPAKGNDPHLRNQFSCATPSSGEGTHPLSGSEKFVPPLDVGTHTYELTAKGPGGNTMCQATVVVPPPPPPPPPPASGCVEVLKETFDPSGAKITPVAQFSFTLDGTTTVTSDSNGRATFSNVTPGTHTVSEVNPGSAWNLISVTPSGGSVTVKSGPTCSAVVFKNQQVIPPPPPSPGAPTCSLDATAEKVTWSSTNAASVAIAPTTMSPSVGSNLAASGSKDFIPPLLVGEHFYKMTVVGTNGDSVFCGARVEVQAPPPSAPSCALFVDRPNIKPGESVTISWTSSQVTSGTINNNVGTASPVSGGTISDIFPPESIQYTGTFTGPKGSVTCTVSVEVEKGGGGGGGGGLNQPTVSLLKSPSDQPLAFVSLTQIPYTGFEAGPLLTALFWLTVALWSAAVAYLIVGKKSMRFVASQLWPGAFVQYTEKSKDDVIAYDALSDSYAEYAAVDTGPLRQTVASAPSQALTPSVISAPGATGSKETSLIEAIESRAHQSGVLLSPEAIQEAARLSTSHDEILRAFGDVVSEAVRTLPREDGWILLSSERLLSIVSSLGRSQAPRGDRDDQGSALDVRESLAGSAVERMVAAVLEGKRDEAFLLLRELESAEVNAIRVAMEAVQTIDHLYQARTQNAPLENLALREKAEGVSPEHLRDLIGIFSSALDTTYTLPYTGLKIALAQAFDRRT